MVKPTEARLVLEANEPNGHLRGTVRVLLQFGAKLSVSEKNNRGLLTQCGGKLSNCRHQKGRALALTELPGKQHNLLLGRKS